jgi:pimeloyl-ACP methyl ester carboxylesterase
VVPTVTTAQLSYTNANLPTWTDDPDARHGSAITPARILDGWFEIDTTMPTLPKVRCDYRIPLETDGRPLATAADLVLAFPYPTEKAAINGLAAKLTDLHGFTTISLRFPGMGPNDGVDENDPTRWYYHPESGSGPAWLTAIDRVRSLAGLPRRRVFVTGRSGGGSAAGLFADAYPDQVDAVANEAGRVFARPPRYKGPVLIMHGAHDYVAPVIDDYVHRAVQMGLPVARLTYPPNWSGRGTNQLWQHGITAAAERAMWSWLIAIADLRLANGGRLPPAGLWPSVWDGARYPSREVAEAMARLARPASVIPLAQSQIITASPPAGQPARGLIVRLVGGFGIQEEPLALDAEFWAEQGWTSLNACGDRIPAVPALRSALARPEFASLSGLPWVAILDDPDGPADYARIREMLRSDPLGICLLRVRSTRQRGFLDALASAGAPLLFFIPAHESEQAADVRRPQLVVRAIPHGSVEQMNAFVCREVLLQAAAWAKHRAR